MSALPVEQMALDTLIEVETGIHPESVPKTNQAKLFVVERETANSGLDAHTSYANPSSVLRKRSSGHVKTISKHKR